MKRLRLRYVALALSVLMLGNVGIALWRSETTYTEPLGLAFLFLVAVLLAYSIVEVVRVDFLRQKTSLIATCVAVGSGIAILGLVVLVSGHGVWMRWNG